MEIYIQGLTMGLAYVAPIGLQNLFVINTALTQPKRRCYLTALIVIFFDVTLGLACFFGIGAIMQSSRVLEMVILLVGSLIVIWIGIGALVPEHHNDNLAVQRQVHRQDTQMDQYHLRRSYHILRHQIAGDIHHNGGIMIRSARMVDHNKNNKIGD